IGISGANGTPLSTATNLSSISLTNVVDDYAVLSGTSMACPHAVGVAALVWGAAPSASANSVRTALFNNAIDLGTPGKDPTFGFGLVDALAAAKWIAPTKFGVPFPGRVILR